MKPFSSELKHSTFNIQRSTSKLRTRTRTIPQSESCVRESPYNHSRSATTKVATWPSGSVSLNQCRTITEVTFAALSQHEPAKGRPTAPRT
jgi:hypothetical protein